MDAQDRFGGTIIRRSAHSRYTKHIGKTRVSLVRTASVLTMLMPLGLSSLIFRIMLVTRYLTVIGKYWLGRIILVHNGEKKCIKVMDIGLKSRRR